MIEYDFSISLESIQKESGRYCMYFPHSCILYLRGNKTEELLQKRLFFLLPFFILRYEKIFLYENEQELSKPLREYTSIELSLEKEFLDNGKEKEYRDLIELILRIADYILKHAQKAKKGLCDVMGGKVLELESDKLIQQGLEQGIQSSALKLLTKGKTVKETAQLLDLPEEQVRKIQLTMLP